MLRQWMRALTPRNNSPSPSTGQLLSKSLNPDSESSVNKVECYATDINPDAISIAAGTIKANGYDNAIVLSDDGESSLSPPSSEVTTNPTQPNYILKLIDLCGAPSNNDDQLPLSSTTRWFGSRGFDFLIFNPPYVPTPQSEVGIYKDPDCSGIEASWAGGEDGRYVIDRALPEIQNVMNLGGVVYMIVVDDNRPEEVLSIMEGKGFEGEVFARRQAKNEFLSVLRMVKVR
jgi:methylase of polypeptide subunit release factors